MNKLRVNILTPIPFWHPGTMELIEGLRSNGLEVVSLDIWELRYIDETNQRHELSPRFLKGIFAKIYKRLFRKKIIKNYIRKNEIVDIQWCGHYYAKYIDYIKKREVKILATLFGSDLYRSKPEEHQVQKKIFDVADKIVMGVNMLEEFEKNFKGFNDKVSFTQFGSKRLELIDEINTEKNKDKLRSKYHIDEDKIVITLGYNAKSEQQHIKFLNQIENLDEKSKDKLFLLLPLTYGRNNIDYLNKVKDNLENLRIDYRCFEERLSDMEIAETKVLSDITVNLQTTDALSSSIKEAMVANDILLVGDWLPYKVYSDLGIFFETCKADSFSQKLIEVIGNIEFYKEECKSNSSKVLDFASWRKIIPEFILIYKSV